MPKNTLIEFNAGMFGNAMFIAPNNDWRHNLQGVFINPSVHGGVNIVATDAHRIIYFYDELGSCSYKKGIIIPKKGLEKLITLSRKSANRKKKITVKCPSNISKYMLKRYSVSLDKKYSISLDNKAVNTFYFKPIDGQFPDLKNIIKNQKIDNEKNNSILYNSKYILDFRHLFVDKRNLNGQQIAINQNKEGHTVACTKNAFYITMPILDGTNKHMIDFIYGLYGEENDIFTKALIKKRGQEGYRFIKDILGVKDAQAIKKPLL